MKTKINKIETKRIIQRTNETDSFFEKINKIDTYPNLLKDRARIHKLTKSRMKRGTKQMSRKYRESKGYALKTCTPYQIGKSKRNG